MYVIQVVGYKNSGKTTLINHWIDYLSSKGYQVATIKHHGHGGEPDQAKDTDSYQHVENGAVYSTVKGVNQFVMTGNNEQLSLATLLNIYEILEINIVIIEGYKEIPFPKVVLLRDEDKLLLDTVENVKYIYRPFSDKNAKKLFGKVEDTFEDFSWNEIKNLLP